MDDKEKALLGAAALGAGGLAAWVLFGRKEQTIPGPGDAKGAISDVKFVPLTEAEYQQLKGGQ